MEPRTRIKDKVFKDKVAGRARVRMTADVGFDFPIDLDIDVEEFPF
jgi:hypothetical protein